MRTLILALALASSSPAYSVVQHDHFPSDLAHRTCDESTQGQEICLARKVKVVDHKIDLVAAALRKASYDAPSRARVDKAEKAWFGFRDADCQSASDLFEGGTEAGVIYEGCELDDSNARLKELKQQLSNLSGNG